MFEAFIERNARIARSNQVLIALRLLFATVALIVLLIGEQRLLIEQALLKSPLADTPFYFRPPGFLIVVVLVLTIAYLILVRAVRDKPVVAARLAALQIFVDILLITGLVWRTEGVNSQFVVLYLMSICAAGFVLKWNASIVAAIVSAILYSSVAIAYSVGFVPEEFRSDAERLKGLQSALTGLGFLRFLLLPIFVFVITGVIAGMISRRLVAANLMRDDILEGIGKGIVMLDRRGKMAYHNREFLRLLDVNETTLSRNLARVLGEQVHAQALNVLKTNVPAKIELIHTRNDGRAVPLMIRVNPIANSTAASRTA